MGLFIQDEDCLGSTRDRATASDPAPFPSLGAFQLSPYELGPTQRSGYLKAGCPEVPPPEASLLGEELGRNLTQSTVCTLAVLKLGDWHLTSLGQTKPNRGIRLKMLYYT